MASLYKRKDSNIWWIKIHREKQGSGRHDRISTRTTDEKQAQLILEKMVGDRANNLPIARKAHTIRFFELLDHVIDDYDNEEYKSKKTVVCRMEKHIMPVFGMMYAQAIRAGDIEKYKTNRRKAGAKPATVRRELELIKRAFAFGNKFYQIQPPHIDMPSVNNAKQGFFEQLDFERVLDAIEDQDYRDVILFAYVTGWRSAEIKDLRRRHVVFAEDCVRLDPGTTKNGDARVFPMTKKVREMFERRLAHKGFSDEHVFTCAPQTTSKCETYRARIEVRINEYLERGNPYGMLTVIYDEIRAAGFDGGYRTVEVYVRRLKASRNPETGKFELGREAEKRGPVGDFGKAFATACYKAGIPCITEPWSYVEPKSGNVYSGVRVLRSTRTLHDFRRSAVKNFTTMGVPDKVAMDLTGHRTRAIFDRYRIVSKADLDVAREKMEAAQERLNAGSDVGTVVGTVTAFSKKTT